MNRLAVFPHDPLSAYCRKGELKTRYWNPENLFDEIHVLSLTPKDVAPEAVQVMAGEAELRVHCLGSRSPLLFPLAIHKANRLLQEIKPDVVRGYDPWHSGTLAVCGGKKIHAPSVISLHTRFDAQRRQERRWLLYLAKLLERYSLPGADMVISVTEYVREYAVANGATNNTVIYNRVYTDQFQPRETYAIASKPILLCVARLDNPKYQECLIRAITGLEVELVLIGRGRNRKYLENLASKLGCLQKITFLESIEHERIGEYYRKADIFLLATHFEGFCIPILEAMASGLPVIASSIPPLPEIMGSTGILSENHPDDFRIHIVKLLESESLRRELGTRARQRAMLLSGKKMEAREAQMYKLLLEKKRNTKKSPKCGNDRVHSMG